MIAAALIHAAVFALAPPYRPRPFRMKADFIRVVNAVLPAVEEGAPAAPPAPAASPPRERVVADAAIRTRSGAAELEPGPATAATSTGAQGSGAAAGAITDEAPPVFYSYDRPPRAIRRVEPAYPPAAREIGAEGMVVVNLNIDERGRIMRAWVATANANEILINAALDAAYQFEFSPGTQRDIPVKCTVAIPFQFILKKRLEATEGP
jgi:protein TonB